MNILVTGGAGYVGSIVVEELLKSDNKVISLDNMQQGHKGAIPNGAEFISMDICALEALDKVFARYHFDAVVHMAAETLVEYSVTDPRRYFRSNVIGGLNLLDTMLKYNVHKIIFSSSAAIYGEPQSDLIDEDHPKTPINSYGESKLMFENILKWYGRAYGLKHISLRYFNAAGATKLLGEDHHPETHLIPNVLKAAWKQSEPVKVFGADYQTRDGSCIRDYVHVKDIAQAHILALYKLGDTSSGAYNLGNGAGYSVFEVVRTAEKVARVKIPVKVSSRRPGDPAVLVASSNKAKQELSWKPQFTELESIVESAWKWLSEHPDGYER
jgi:UDP-glucose 4-epimerase